jgi:hypothetical protein
MAIPLVLPEVTGMAYLTDEHPSKSTLPTN